MQYETDKCKYSVFILCSGVEYTGFSQSPVESKRQGSGGAVRVGKKGERGELIGEYSSDMKMTQTLNHICA